MVPPLRFVCEGDRPVVRRPVRGTGRRVQFGRRSGDTRRHARPRISEKRGSCVCAASERP